ncbi:restriction endonuclease subunit S [Alistipes putredinis]|uniref:restriction endonuclease subunit S n=1 Tax=Alistipes putredinis TaxID=28117 RepID=UPI00399274A0
MVIVLTHSLTELSVHTPHYENVPFEVPKGWVWTTLGSISNYGTSINVQVGDIDSNEWILELEDIEKDTAKIIQHLSKKERFLNGTRHKFQKGDILYSKLRTYLNKVLVASNGGFCSTEIMPFGTYGVLSNEYICHVLRSNHFLDYTLRCGYGVKMPRLSTNDACKGMIPLPPLAEQQRIVTEIEKWFSLIDQIEQGKDDLHSIVKQTKSKILDLAIHGELVPQDPNDEPAIELLKRINPSFTPCDNGHYPQLPDSWTIVPMQMLCSLTDGEKLDGKGMPNLDVKYLRGERDFKTLTNGRYVAANSLLILVDGENSGEVFRTPIEGYQGSTFKQLHINENMLAEYILHVINLHRKALRENKVGSAIPHLDKKLFKAIEVPVPPYDEQVRIVTVINSMHSKLDAIMENL